MKVGYLTCLFSLFLTTRAHSELWTELDYHSGTSELFACVNLISETFVFDFVPEETLIYSAYYDAVCGYPPAMGTALLCAQYYAHNDTQLMNRIINLAAEVCLEYTASNSDFNVLSSQLENATLYYQPMDTTANFSEPLYFPTLPDVAVGQDIVTGSLWYYFNLDNGTWYSVGICGYFLLLIVLGSIYNFIRVSGLIKNVGKLRLTKMIQSYIVFPTLFPNGKFAQSYGWKWFSILFPNRPQFLVDLFLCALQIAFYCVPYHENEGVATRKLNWMIGDRTGIMAFGKIPLLILFAGRNNFLLYITGWSYTTFLHFHKIIAYWMSLDILIHSVVWTILELGYYTNDLKQTYFACGVAATTLCFIMCGFAFYTLRKNYYEYFIISHIAMAMGFIGCCWWHCNILGWMEWLVAACVVWVFDRVVRVLRMSAFGSRKAVITAVGDELLMISVARPSWWSTTSGQYAYVYLGGLLFWQNHPFTIVCKDDKIMAFIKVKNGITKRIWNELSKSGGSMERHISLEGPYGSPGSGGIKKMDDVFLFAGGSGAPAIIDSASHVSKGKLFWVVPDFGMVKAYSNLFKDVKIQTEIYVTRETGIETKYSFNDFFETVLGDDTGSSEEKACGDQEKSFAASDSFITVHYQRPDLKQIVNDEITASQETSVGILGCGPPAMMDTLRNVAAVATTTTEKSVNFYDELQVW